MRSLGLPLVLALAALVSVGSTGCQRPTARVALGQRYATGEPRYDAYFREVHTLQIAAATWVDERRAARRPLFNALDLAPDAADATIAQATHERLDALARDGGGTRLDVNDGNARLVAVAIAHPDGTFFRSIEDAAKNELARAKRLEAVSPRVDVLLQQGHALEPQVQGVFVRRAPGQISEVEDELSSSFDALESLRGKARRASREATDFVADLQRAAAAGFEASRSSRAKAPPGASIPPAPKAAPRKEPPPRAVPRPRVEAKPDEESKPKVAPAPKPAAEPSEVFSP